jgi:hypothetical protein
MEILVKFSHLSIVYYRLEKSGVYIDGNFGEKLGASFYGLLQACGERGLKMEILVKIRGVFL